MSSNEEHYWEYREEENRFRYEQRYKPYIDPRSPDYIAPESEDETMGKDSE